MKCLWDENICEIAAAYGYLECLKYAHENGCSWMLVRVIMPL